VALDAGTRIGSYEIGALLGRGGMGEVYRARDSRLRRDVALKVLPASMAGDRDRMARFEREAQVLATLNHPHIAAIYGFEEHDGQHAIVMELVEGRELAVPQPVDEALRLALQMAEALEYAHERGVVHRDLKPANVRVTSDGAVKLLDFGLAKALETTGVDDAETRLAHSPTLSLAATQAGTILGTAAYMSPEQAKGRPSDRRGDIWTFGVVLFELLTGQRLFAGETVSETLANVIKDPVAIDTLPHDTPPSVRRLVARCVDRDLRRRLQSMGEARIVIEDAVSGVHAAESVSAPPSRASGLWLAWALAALATVVAGATAFAWWTRTDSVSPGPTYSYTIPPPPGTMLTTFRPAGPGLAVSPDGRSVAFVAEEKGVAHLWIRDLASMGVRRVDGTQGAYYPFWSPDSRHVGYFANGKLARVSPAGGSPSVICDAPDGEGGAWWQDAGDDGVVVFAPQQAGPLQRVRAAGGIPEAATTLADGEQAHAFPQFLPGGQRVLFAVRGGPKPGLHVATLGQRDHRFVLDSGRAVLAPPDWLLYANGPTLMARRLNLDTLQLEAEAAIVAERVSTGTSSQRTAFSVSATGVLAYRSGLGSDSTQVSRFSRDGRHLGVVLEPGEYSQLALSPDSRRLAVSRIVAGQRNVWVKDLASGVVSKATSAYGETGVVWSPDSTRVAFSNRQLFEAALGSGKEVVVSGFEDWGRLEDWTPDGEFLVSKNGDSVFLVPAHASAASAANVAPRAIFTEPYQIDNIRVSPDGRWVAYMSTESGVAQVVVAAFPSFEQRRQVSTVTASQPVWRADGRELFFHIGSLKLAAVDVTPRAEGLEVGPVRELFDTSVAMLSQSVHLYDVTRDGQEFFVREPAGGTAAVEPLYVVTSWLARLSR
jgi:Tol biopolymer transport system component